MRTAPAAAAWAWRSSRTPSSGCPARSRSRATPGQGTRFTIQLPLTLAIADALIGRVGDESFAVPQSAVREVIEVAAGDVRRIEGNEIIPYRDGRCRIVRLARLFGIAGETSAAVSRLRDSARARRAIGLAVDRIVGQREIVVRTIADPLVRVDGISGATDLGDGTSGADPRSGGARPRRHATAHATRRRGRRRHGDASAHEALMTDQRHVTDTYIVFAVAGTPYALRSADVQHVEMVEQVTRVPNAAPFVDGVVFSRGQVVPAVNLRSRFGFERVPYDLRTRLIVVQTARTSASASSSTKGANSCACRRRPSIRRRSRSPV